MNSTGDDSKNKNMEMVNTPMDTLSGAAVFFAAFFISLPRGDTL